MADRLYLSYWVRGFTEHNMLRHFEAMLRRFPFSRLNPRVQLRVCAFEEIEPPALERQFGDPIDLDAVIHAAAEFQHPDCAYHVDTAWDIWQFETGWELRPAAVTLSCYGPLFASELGEQLRVGFGLDFQFLPQPEIHSYVVPVRHNIRALLHLAEDLDASLAVEKRRLWSESGENFAERLQAVLLEDSTQT